MVHNVGGHRCDFWKIALIAGFAGGMAEIAWVGSYCYWIGMSGAEVARQVAVSVTASGEYPAAPVLGILIHLALSLAVAAVYAALVWRPFAARYGAALSILSALAVLGAIWAVNFLLVLPLLNPGFVKLMPYPVSVVSKLLFGVCMALACECTRNRYLFHPHGARRAMAARSV